MLYSLLCTRLGSSIFIFTAIDFNVRVVPLLAHQNISHLAELERLNEIPTLALPCRRCHGLQNRSAVGCCQCADLLLLHERLHLTLVLVANASLHGCHLLELHWNAKVDLALHNWLPARWHRHWHLDELDWCLHDGNRDHGGHAIAEGVPSVVLHRDFEEVVDFDDLTSD